MQFGRFGVNCFRAIGTRRSAQIRSGVIILEAAIAAYQGWKRAMRRSFGNRFQHAANPVVAGFVDACLARIGSAEDPS
jgi:hypothetical protein